MGYNPLDVSTGKGDTLIGPMLWNPTVQLEEIEDFDFSFPANEGWVKLGEGHTDGIDHTQEADSLDKQVWGSKSLGRTYSNFVDTVTARFVSWTDEDVRKCLFGENQVMSSNGVTRVYVTNRTPEYGTFVFLTKTDDGRKQWLVVPRGQVDPNLSVTMGDGDITMAETTILATVATITRDGEEREASSYYIYESAESSTEPVDPEPSDPEDDEEDTF